MKRIYALFIVMLLTATQFAFAAVNLNTATQAELETVKGIGPVKAKMIVEDRTKNGPFKSIEELDRVKGFGTKSVNKLRGEVSVSGATQISPAANKAATKPASKVQAAPAQTTPVTPAPPAKTLSKKETKAAAKAAKKAEMQKTTPPPATH